MIKAFVFDMDGVITETASLHYKAWRDEVKLLGVNFTEQENLSLKGLPRYDTLRAILKMHGKLDEVTEADIIRMGDHKNEEYKKMLNTGLSKENILPGIEKFINDAREKGITIVIASSSLNAPLILEKTNLINLMDIIVDPTSVANGKPAPDIYLKGCELAGVQPHEAIGFEDAISGVRGLKKAGIKTVAITWGDKEDWEIADLIVESTKELTLEKVLKIAE